MQSLSDLREMPAMHRPPRLKLRLLGAFSLERDGQPCLLSYEKGRALLSYLAMTPGRAISRASLATMLWPELVRETALANLRQVLHDLRQTLNEAGAKAPPLQVDREAIRLDPVADLEIDVLQFSAPATACPAIPCPEYCDPCLEQMERLAGSYRGEFMAEFSLPECPDFEEWLQVQREALHLRALALLTRLAECHERNKAYAGALPFALRFLELEPWSEEGLRRTMRLFALNGQRSDALAQYETSCRVLKRELGVLPSDETMALEALIRRGDLSPERRRTADALPEHLLPMPVAARRQVTVLYCELGLSGVEDQDEALTLLRVPQARCSEIIREYAGHLVQIRGGSLLAYFGYPHASENAARHAVQAALAVTRTAFAGLEVRAGIHTGMVISDDPQTPDAVGATSGLAIRLRQLVDPGEVAISDASNHLISGYFDFTSLGLRHLRGIARPLEVFRVERESGARDRLEAATRLTPLVGREDEIKTLLDAWQDARQGARRIVALRGEAGIGKSRLVLSLKEALRERGDPVHELRCFPEHSQSPFHPLIAWFGLILGFSPDDNPEARFGKLVADVQKYFTGSVQEAVPLLARMLALPVLAPYREPTVSAQLQRERMLAILLDHLDALAAPQAMLLVVEDLQWADPSTLELLKLSIEGKRPTPMLAVLTARLEFVPPWEDELACTLPLKTLPDAETAMLISVVAPELTPAVVGHIVQRADGIPLFAEELAREAAANETIPATLQDLLATRLDALGPAKSVAQTAASIGREFSVDLLRRIVRCDETALVQLLRQLQDARIVRGASAGDLQFGHALVRDAAYQSQTRDERESAHRRIATALRTGGADVRPELLAQHWAAGGETREAIACWIAAGKIASLCSACHEAVLHFRSGLALIEALPAGSERTSFELDLQIGLGAAASAMEGYASTQGVAAYARAMSLCSDHESAPEMFRAVWGLWASASSRSGYPHALKLAHQLQRMASRSGDPLRDQQGHFAVADTLYWQGEFVAAREHLERVGMLYQPDQHETHVAEFGEDPGVTSGSYLSWTLWFIGYPDQARAASAQTLALARRLGHPFSLAYALAFASILHCRLRQPTEALALAQETLSLANGHGFSLWQIGATLSRGWALAMQHQREGVDCVQQCIEATRAAMGGVTLVVLEPMVDACLALGLVDQALSVCHEAIATGNAIGDHHVEAELHRLQGESLLALTDTPQAEAAACFARALTTSRRQHAKSLELRAATSMARLWRKQGKQDEARRLLNEVYHWFSEGFDTPDLRDARALLDSIG
jgi:DNA-binding SARP family transcriptional activator/predicted ATPase